jgi:hypothetical protein
MPEIGKFGKGESQPAEVFALPDLAAVFYKFCMGSVEYLVESLELQDGQVKYGMYMTGDLGDTVEAVHEIMFHLNCSFRCVMVFKFKTLQGRLELSITGQPIEFLLESGKILIDLIGIQDELGYMFTGYGNAMIVHKKESG